MTQLNTVQRRELESSKTALRSGGAKPRLQTAARTIAVLLAISRSDNGLKVKELKEQLDLPLQVTYNLLHTLLGAGVVRKNEQNRYVLGLASAAIADGFRRQLAPLESVLPRVRAAVSATGETTYVSGWVDDRIAVLASARGQSPVQAAEIPYGYSGHMHARASGKLLLALAPPSTRDEFLAANPLVAVTKNTITSRERFLEELKLIERRGYAVDNEEFVEGLCCLAVPLDGAASRFALGIAVPTERFQANFDRYLASLQEVVQMRRDRP